MKTSVSRKAKQLGNALLVAMCISAFLCISITGYLSVTEQQSFLSARSQAWNMAISITEAGVEEGLQQLNSNSSSLSTDGWAYDGSSYWRSNNMGGGNSYTVNIYVTNSLNPTIVARAFTTPPTMAQNSSGIFFAAANVTIASSTVTRAVRVTCAKPNYFSAALVAQQGINMNGNGVYSDSFDSQNPLKSVNGKYSQATYAGDKGDIATNGGITNSVSIQNANIYGKVHTGPNCPVTIGPNGGIGPHANQTSSTATATANGGLVQDANFTFPDTTYPDTSSYLSLPPGGTVVTTSYTYTPNAINGSAAYPNPPPPWGSVTTNNNPATVNTCPNPVPPGLTTNLVSNTSPSYPAAGSYTGTVATNTQTSSQTGRTYPTAGTYTGTVSSNNVTTGPPANRGWWYTYNLITGHTYTYNTFTYTYPVYTYNYDTFTTNTIYATNTYDTILTANNSYVASSLSNKKVLINGPGVVLALPNGMDGTEGLTWATGANLLVHSGGTSITVAGNGYINPNGSAGSLIIYAAPTVTSFTLNGNGQFTGVLVAPSADVAMNGGGNSNEDFCGSLMCKSITLNGHFSFHYDESLTSSSTTGRYLVSTWNEIP